MLYFNETHIIRIKYPAYYGNCHPTWINVLNVSSAGLLISVYRRLFHSAIFIKFFHLEPPLSGVRVVINDVGLHQNWNWGPSQLNTYPLSSVPNKGYQFPAGTGRASGCKMWGVVPPLSCSSKYGNPYTYQSPQRQVLVFWQRKTSLKQAACHHLIGRGDLETTTQGFWVPCIFDAILSKLEINPQR